MERCTRCLLPRNYPRTEFDSQGVCELCNHYVPTKLLGADRLLQSIRQNKRPGSKYDCVVALSGGRDSTYTLYFLVRELGLKVAAYTVDQGFLPPETVQNIQRAVSVLNVDHKFYHHDLSMKAAGPMLRAWVRRPDPAMVSLVCLGCRTALLEALLDSGDEYKAPLVLGGGEPGCDEYFGARFFTRDSNTKAGKAAILFGIGRRLLENPHYLSGRAIPSLLFKEYLQVFYLTARRGAGRTDIFNLYFYVDWDEPKIQSTIEQELGWQRCGSSEAAWRSDCKLAVLKNQMYFHSLGFTRNDILVSALVRCGKLTREQGLARLKAENRYRPEVVAELCKDVAGLTNIGDWRPLSKEPDALAVSK